MVSLAKSGSSGSKKKPQTLSTIQAQSDLEVQVDSNKSDLPLQVRSQIMSAGKEIDHSDDKEREEKVTKQIQALQQEITPAVQPE